MSRRRTPLRVEECEPRRLLSVVGARITALGDFPPGHGAHQSPSEAPGATTKFVPNNAIKIGPTVTPTTTGREGEEDIAVDPNNPDHLVATISDYSQLRDPVDGLKPNTTKYAFSTTGGATWTDAFVPFDSTSGMLLTSDRLPWLFNSDPVVAIDSHGRAYLSELDFNDPGTNGSNANGIYVSVGNFTNSGLTFTQANTRPVFVNSDPNTANFEDKDWLAVDNAPASPYNGNVYVTWTHFDATGSITIDLSRSTDHGQTWSAPLGVSQTVPVTSPDILQFSQVAVGPHGEVYVVYEDVLTYNDPTNPYEGGTAQLWLAKSTDGGQTFSAPHLITGVFNEQDVNLFPTSYRFSSAPSLAVGPDGSLDVVYTDQVGTNSQVEFIRSTNGGASFSAPIALNDVSSGFRTMPAIAVDQPTGAIWVIWFDTRNSSDVNFYDIYATESPNGKTFKQNVRVTPSLQDGITGGGMFIGDYAGIAAEGGVAHPVWTSGEHHNDASHLQTTTLSQSAAASNGAAASSADTAQAAVTVLVPLGDPTSSGISNALLPPGDPHKKNSR
jgi:hypothetical protein